jgi:hypothetical protein
MTINNDGLYSKALSRIRTEYFPSTQGKTFTSDDVYRFFQIDKKPNSVEAKKSISQVLWNLAHANKKNELEQIGKTYRLIDRTLNVIEWWKAIKGDVLGISFPRGVEDNTTFGFEDSIIIYPKDLIVLAGEGNTAKTAWCINFMIENMDNYPVFYFSSEFNDAKFVDRMSHFNWVNLFKENGEPKFTLVEQTENWQDKIQPNAINIIDWIYLDDEMWKIRTIMKNIISNLERGLAIVVLQKRSYKSVGEGGEGTKDLASVYLTIRNDKELRKTVLKVEKVKSPRSGVDDLGHIILNPNFREWSFEVVNNGSKFCNITPLDK